MLGGLCILVVIVLSLIHAIILLFISTRHIMLKTLAIAAVLMPIVLFLSMIMLLGAMGHPPAP
jgi:hypothetical protein